jgi:arylsulfatase A-like enzyme
VAPEDSRTGACLLPEKVAARWRAATRRGQFVIAVLLLVFSVVGCVARPGPDRIVLVVIDTLRRDRLSCYGSPTPTPNIDALAARGTRFTNASSSFHQTTMSMAALFTGRTPSIESEDAQHPLPWNGTNWCGLARFTGPGGACVPASVPTLAGALRKAGYATVGIVSNPHLFRPTGYDRGFEEWVEVRRLHDDTRLAAQGRAGQQVNAAVRDWLGRRQSDRFFLYVHYMDVHDWVIVGTTYEQGVVASDRFFGELRDMLAAEQLLDDAVVVLTADHGEALGEPHPLRSTLTHYGNPSYETVLGVPLIVAPPVGGDPARFIRSDDTFRLVKTLAGVGDDTPMDLASDELLLTEQSYRTYRKGRWKSMWARGDGTLHLFDLERDPGELKDVASAHPEQALAHRHRVDVIVRALAVAGRREGARSPADRERLRSLGYLE